MTNQLLYTILLLKRHSTSGRRSFQSLYIISLLEIYIPGIRLVIILNIIKLFNKAGNICIRKQSNSLSICTYY